MSRKLLALLVASLLLLTLATYVYYRRTLAAVPVDPYALVPDDAVLVLATRNHPALVRHLQEAGVWDNITGVRYYQQVAGQLALADSLANGGKAPGPTAGQRRGLLAFLGNKLVLSSLHVTGPRQVDVLYQVPLANVREYRQARALLETLGRDPRYTLGTRFYQDQELQELTERDGARLTLFNYRNHLVFSTHAPLVEAVVQRLAHPDAPTVRASFGQTDLLRLRDLDATLLINFRRLPTLLDVLCQPGTHSQLDQALGLAREGLLGLKLGPGQLTGTGFANPETASRAWQSQLASQPVQSLRPLAEVLSQHTALALTIAGTLPLAPAANPAGQPVLDSLRAALLPGATLVYLAAPSPAAAPAPLLLLRCRSAGQTAGWLAQLRRLGHVSPAFERVGRFELYQTPLEGSQLAGPLGGSARDSLGIRTALVDGYLALGEINTLRRYLADVSAGLTWSRSATQVALVQQALPQARLTILADVRQGWNALLGALAEDRRAGLLRNESLLRRFPQVAWQLLPPDQPTAPADPAGQYYTQLLLRRPSQTANPDSTQAARAGVRFGAALAGQPLLLAAAEATYSAVVGDSAGGLRLLPGSPAARAWADTLPGPAVGSGARLVRGRLLLATAHRVHWLSVADGREAPGFPLNLPDSMTIAAVAATPTTPRLLVATTAQDLLLLDTNGRRYAGWPRRLEAPLAGPPLLLTVGGRDVVVAALRNGYVYAFDQAGSRYPGFPVSAGARLDGPLLATAGPTLARSQLRLVNQHGELLTMTLSGDIAARRRIATWSRTASFQLVPEALGKPGAFVVARQDGGQLDVFSPASTAPLLSRQLLTSGNKPMQWFDFDAGHQVLALTEPVPGQVWLFDGQGRPLAPGGGGPSAAWSSTGTGVALRYDAARHRYLLVRYLHHELRRDELREP